MLKCVSLPPFQEDNSKTCMKVFLSDECVGCLSVAYFRDKSCFTCSSRRLFIRAIFIRGLTFRTVAVEKNPGRIANWVHVSATDEQENVLANVNAQAHPYPRRDIGIRRRKKAIELRAITSYIYASLIHSETQRRQCNVKTMRHIFQKLCQPTPSLIFAHLLLSASRVMQEHPFVHKCRIFVSQKY